MIVTAAKSCCHRCVPIPCDGVVTGDQPIHQLFRKYGDFQNNPDSALLPVDGGMPIYLQDDSAPDLEIHALQYWLGHPPVRDATRQIAPAATQQKKPMALAIETTVIPQMVDGGMVRCILWIITNADATRNASYHINFYGDDGQPLAFPFKRLAGWII